jgi:hypothetical protein
LIILSIKDTTGAAIVYENPFDLSIIQADENKGC